MAPDLSNVSQSGNLPPVVPSSQSSQPSPSLSRRTSGMMAPPPVPHNNSLPNSPRPLNNAGAEASTYGGSSTGPIRHPRPLTAAELHLELEKEQESIVNRLTRELSALRAQTASVASTASSTSDLFTTHPSELQSSSYQTGNVPTPARRHRSSSNLSSRSARSARDALTSSATATSVSGVAAPRDRDHSISHQTSSRPSMDIPRPEISRQNSMSGIAMHRTPSNNAHPLTSSPHWTTTSHGQSQYPNSRHSMSSNYSTQGPEHVRTPSSSAAIAAARYEEAALHRAELEAIKKENDALKQKIRDLEKALTGRRESTGPGHAAAGSTTTGKPVDSA